MHHNSQHINIKASDEKLAGVYANSMQISHTNDEFVLDFLNILPPTGTLNARVIVSPSHFKSMLKAMEDSLKKFEEQHGSVNESESPGEYIGFQA